MSLPPLTSIVQNCQIDAIRSLLRICHIPGLVCQDRPPMNIFLEKKDDSIRFAVQPRVIWRKRKWTRGDCQQRVTSGTTLRPPAQSPALGSRCHYTSTNNRTTPVSSFHANTLRSRRARRPDLSDRGQNVSLFLGPAPPLHILLFLACDSPHTWIDSLIQPNLIFTIFFCIMKVPSISNLCRQKMYDLYILFFRNRWSK